MSVKFCSLSSGSNGNCQYIETKQSRILIDAGLSGVKIERLLKSIEVCPKTIDSILVTHEHIDHIHGVGVLSRRYDIPILANENTWLAMTNKIGQIKSHNIKVFQSNKSFNFRDMDITPIKTFHDAAEPVGFIINYKNKKLSLFTDTGMVNDYIVDNMKDSDLYFIESNHDIDMLKEGSYPWPLKQRILSSIGHLSNLDAGKILTRVLSGRMEKVLLAHLSQDNNIPRLALETVKDYLTEKGINVDQDISVELTHREKATKIYQF